MNDFTREELESIRDNLVVPECFIQKSIEEYDEGTM